MFTTTDENEAPLSLLCDYINSGFRRKTNFDYE